MTTSWRKIMLLRSFVSTMLGKDPKITNFTY